MPNPTLSTNDLAILLNLNVSTVKRWADSGRLVCIRTPGGHRRFSLEDVYAFLRARGYDPRSLAPLMQAREPDGELNEAIRYRRWDRLRDCLVARALEGQIREAVKLFVAMHLAGVQPCELCDRLVTPAEEQVGRGVARNYLGIAEAHLVSHVLVSAVAEMRPHWRSYREQPFRALCGALTPDVDELPFQCANQLLISEGWNTLPLGANVPGESFISAMERYLPALVCISSSVVHDPIGFRADCERVCAVAEAMGSRVVLGNGAAPVMNGHSAGTVLTLVRDTRGLVDYVRSTFREAV